MLEPVWLRDPGDNGVGYPLIAVPVPGSPGILYAGPIPGRLRDRLAATHLDLLVEAGVTRILCLVPLYAVASALLMPSYEPAARARFAERFEVLPIADFGLPPDADAFDRSIVSVSEALAAGERVLVHCAAGCGRTGLFVSCLLVTRGLTPEQAVAHYVQHRGCGPETEEQVAWVADFARRQAN